MRGYCIYCRVVLKSERTVELLVWIIRSHSIKEAFIDALRWESTLEGQLVLVIKR